MVRQNMTGCQRATNGTTERSALGTRAGERVVKTLQRLTQPYR